MRDDLQPADLRAQALYYYGFSLASYGYVIAARNVLSAVSPQAQEGKSLKLFARALLYGLATATGAFAAMAAALWGPAALRLTRNAYIWLAIGSLIPGTVAFLLERRASQDKLEAVADRENAVIERNNATAARERSKALEQVIEAQINRAEADRADTGRALNRLGGAIMQIVRASDFDRSSEVAHFEQLLVQVLWFTLDKRLEKRDSKLRVMFLIHHGGSAIGQPEPQATDDGLAPIVYHARSLMGYNDGHPYTIRQSSPDDVFAKRLLAQESVLKDGFLIEDTRKKSSAEECPLMPVGEDIKSYCRMAVRDPTTHHGILCVDAWEPGMLNIGDREVVGAFAAMLAVGLTLGLSHGSQDYGR